MGWLSYSGTRYLKRWRLDITAGDPDGYPTISNSYEAGEDNELSTYGAYWRAQNFVPGQDYTVGLVGIKCYTVGSPGNMTIQIRSSDGSHKPSGTVLAYNTTTTGNDFGATPGKWKTITLTTTAALTSGTEYFLVAAAPSGNSTNKIVWKLDTGSSGNYCCESANSGASWSADSATWKMMYRVYGAYTGGRTVPADYKLPANIYRGSQTVETGNWTINSKEYRYRIPFTLRTNDALAADYTAKVVVDTAGLVTGSFFGGSTATYGKTVEWVDNAGNPMKYWATESGSGVPDNFNTTGTTYYVKFPSGLSASTPYTMYLYVDPALSDASTNYSGANTFAFFEHFDTDAANLAAFLAAYDGDPNNDWDTDPGNATVTVASSVLNVTGSGSPSGLATAFNASNLIVMGKITSTAVHNTAFGIFDAAGVGAANNKDGLYWEQTTTWTRYRDNAVTTEIPPMPTAPHIVKVSKCGAFYQWRIFENLPASEPDITYQNTGAVAGFNSLAATNEAHRIIIYCPTDTHTISLDWIAAMPEISGPPIISFPDATYSKSGAVFLGGSCLHWPYDIAFTAEDGTTELYWWPDPKTELTRQPGDSMQAIVKVSADLTSNASIYIYYGNSAVTTTHAHCSAADTFDIFDAFADDTAWIEVAGDWSVSAVQEPAVWQGEVGNIGGQAGRYNGNAVEVIKWAENDYRMVVCYNSWELASQHWPAFAWVGYSQATTPIGPWAPVRKLISVPEYEHANFGTWPQYLWTENTGPGGALRAYLVISTTNGFKLAYTDTMDQYDWTINANGPFMDGAWVTARSGGLDPANVRSFNVVKVGSTYYVFFCAMNIPGLGYATTTDAPEDWDADSFTYGDTIHDGYADYGFGCIVHDVANELWYWFVDTNLSVPGYMTTTDANFPIGWTPNTGTPTSVTFDKAMFGNYGATGSWVFEDGGYYYFYCTGQPKAGDDTLVDKWNPNWIQVCRSATLDGSYTAQLTDSKYKQATTTGTQKTYVSGSSVADGEIIVEINSKNAADRKAGILFRYNSVTDSGYACYLDYYAGNPFVSLDRIDAGANTPIGAGDVDIPTVPVPQYYLGMPWRLRVQFYGQHITVSYSPWGNDWVETHDITDYTYTTGKVGLITITAEAYFDNFRARDYVETEPYFSATQDVFGFWDSREIVTGTKLQGVALAAGYKINGVTL